MTSKSATLRSYNLGTRTTLSWRGRQRRGLRASRSGHRVEGRTSLSYAGSPFKSTVAVHTSPSDTLRRLWFAFVVSDSQSLSVIYSIID
jgi:hypothetical protein